MSSPCDRFEDVWELAMLGTAEATLLDAMQVHLRSGCPSCQALFIEAQQALAAVGTTVPQLRPSPAVEDKLRARLNKSAIATRNRSFYSGFTPWLAVAAALAVIVWLGIDRVRLTRQLSAAQAKNTSPVTPAVPLTPLITRPMENKSRESALQARVEELRRRLDEETRARAARTSELKRLQEEASTAAAKANDAQAQLAMLRAAHEEAPLPAAIPKPSDQDARLTELNQQLAQKDAEIHASTATIRQYAGRIADLRQILRVLDAPGLKEVDMKSVDSKTRGATARALMAPGTGLVLLARQLPKLPPEKCYQLWIIRQGAPAIVSGGILTTDTEGRGVLFLPSTQSLVHASGFAITDEPAGGSVSAKGHKLLFGAIS